MVAKIAPEKRDYRKLTDSHRLAVERDQEWLSDNLKFAGRRI
jgi:hypothetical protein